MSYLSRVLIGCSAALALSSHPLTAVAQTVTVVEYYHRGLDSYFTTGRNNEQTILDTLTADFTRTGAQFSAFAPMTPLNHPDNVCRFYVALATPFVSSHFLGREATDCTILRELALQGFNYEGIDFAIATPFANGNCPLNAPVAIYRSFRPVKNGRTLNHRYTTSRADYDALTASGWAPEGVAFCATAATAAATSNRSGFKRVVSAASTPFAPGCDGVIGGAGILNRGAEVEPYVARNPSNENHLLASWQQDRWSNGGAAGLGGAVSFDGGLSWSNHYLPFSRCAGGNAQSGGDFERATDPWSAIGADGVAYQMALSTSGQSFTPTGVSAMLVARSLDGGRNWDRPVTLVLDVGATVFHDKNMMVADPTDSRFAYAVWGRLSPDGSGPAWFSRTTDRGATWEPSRGIYDPGTRNQAFANQLVVMPNGTLINSFLEFLRDTQGRITSARLRVIRSSDKGVTWSAPIDVAQYLGVGTIDPETRSAVRDGAGIAALAVDPDNSLHMVWQDARFNAGAYDAIAYSRSNDGGLTWSAPLRVNARADVRAFTPTVHVRKDGIVGVAYYDLRDNTADSATLPTVLRLATSSDGRTWHESEIEAAFNLNTAPVARGLFLGDYIALTSRAGAFEAFYTRTTGLAPNDRTEAVFASMPEGHLKRVYVPTDERSTAEEISSEFRERVRENLERVIASRRHER